MKRIMEIRGAEGGKDSALFATDLAKAYSKFFARVGWINHLTVNGDGNITIEITGDDLTKLHNETGGMRIQRVPPTEKKGRVHTSTVTVSVMEPPEIATIVFNEKDFKIEWYSGTGAGGQNRNKVQASCRLTHLSSGITSRAQTRSRISSLADATASILAKLNSGSSTDERMKMSSTRKAQTGSGMRGDKTRTYRFQDNIVKDHVTGKTASVTKVLSGFFDLLWD